MCCHYGFRKFKTTSHTPLTAHVYLHIDYLYGIISMTINLYICIFVRIQIIVNH